MNPSAGDTVIPTNTSSETTGDQPALEDGCRHNLDRSESKPVTRKRRQIEPPPAKMEIPRKTPRHEDLSANRRIHFDAASISAKSHVDEIQQRPLKRPLSASINALCKELKKKVIKNHPTNDKQNSMDVKNIEIPKENIIDNKTISVNEENSVIDSEKVSSIDTKFCGELSSNENEGNDGANEIQETPDVDEILVEETLSMTNQKLEVAMNLSKDKEVSGLLKKPPDASKRCGRRTEKVDDVMRLRKTIQWLEEGARRMREDLAAVRSELHEERKATKLARRDLETAIRDTRVLEAAKNQQIISDLKLR